MKIMANELSSAVSACFQVADRGAVPIMNCIRFTSDGSICELVASDTDQTLTVRVACSGDGKFCIDAGSLSQKMKSLRTGEVDIRVDEKSITVSQGRTKWVIPTLPHGDYPSDVANPTKGQAIRLPAKFRADLNAVQAHASIDETRAMLAGVLFDGNRLVGTDGHKMAAIEVDANLPMVTVPSSACSKLSLLDGDIDVSISAYSATFSTEYRTLKTLLIADAYPDWRRVIPTLPHSAIVDRNDFLASVSRAGAIRADGDKAKAVYMRVDFGEDEIEIEARNSANEEGVDYVKCERDGPAAFVGFNGSLLAEVLATLDADSIRIRYQDERSPVIMEPVAGSRENMRVVMPIRLPPGFSK